MKMNTNNNPQSNHIIQRALLDKLNQLLTAQGCKQGLDIRAVPTGLNRGTGTRDYTLGPCDLPANDDVLKRAFGAIAGVIYDENKPDGGEQWAASYDWLMRRWDQVGERMVIVGAKPLPDDPSAQYYLLTSKSPGVQTALRLYSGGMEHSLHFCLDYVHLVPRKGSTGQTLVPIPEVIPPTHRLFAKILGPDGYMEIISLSKTAETEFNNYPSAECRELRRPREGEDVYFVMEGFTCIYEREGEEDFEFVVPIRPRPPVGPFPVALADISLG